MIPPEILAPLEIGLIFSIVTLGIYLSYRISDFPDLGVDGTFPLGAAVSAKLLVQGVDPLLAIIAATLCGMAAGWCTAWLHTRWKITPLLSGIITMIGLYSINLRIMGSANLSFFHSTTLFTGTSKIGVLIAINIVLFAMVGYFLATEIGLSMRASGTNPKGSEMQGVNIKKMKILALMMSNRSEEHTSEL